MKVKLDMKTEDILPTVKAYTDSFNYVCSVGWENREHNAVRLHSETYQHCKQFLPSQLVCSSRNKASEALKSVKTRSRQGQKVCCPASKMSSIRYDDRSYNVLFDKRVVSILTISGRLKTGFSVPPSFDEFIDWRRKSAELFIKDGNVFLGIVLEKDVLDTKSNGMFVGVDRGIKKIAVTSNNVFYGGGRTKKVINRYRRLRKKLQSKGTKSAKRHLRKIREKENRFRRDVNHVVSKGIVSSLQEGTTIVLEDLTNIRESSKRFRKEQRYWINGWSFYQLECFLKYKAMSKGCLVEYVDARYTSQKCSRCGHTERGNRTKQSLFKCRSCGYELNADLNAARNISKNYQDAKGYLGMAEVKQPSVAGTIVSSYKPRNSLRGI
jgi:IS605 OrfB family transposase